MTETTYQRPHTTGVMPNSFRHLLWARSFHQSFTTSPDTYDRRPSRLNINARDLRLLPTSYNIPSQYLLYFCSHMKRVLVSLLAILYLAAGVGFTMREHYCMGDRIGAV